MKKLLLIAAAIALIAPQVFPEKLNLVNGTSRILKYDYVEKAEVLKKKTANATVLSQKEVLVEAKAAGETDVLIYTDKGVEKIELSVREPSAGKNMVEVDVQILEIVNFDGGDFGVDWPTLLGGKSLGQADASGLMSALQIKEQDPSMVKFGTFNRGPVSVLIDFLVKKNYAKMLAKPKILASDGKKAEFLSGGEIPISITDSQGRTTIEWKSYGVNLKIRPEIIRDNSIRAELKAEVSNLDYANAVKIGMGDGVMPAVKTRWAETVITIGPDETIIIAGLIQNEEARVTSGVPILSEIPLLGELFKTTHTENKKTELVIFVTPKIVGES